MKQLLELLNEMIDKGLIGSYALGGATALIHYFEPIQTQDIDVFVALSNQKDQLVNLSPIYSFLKNKGIELEGEYFLIGSTPVQLLVPYNDLVEEAVRDATSSKFLDADVRIPSLEHLMAIMVQTNRLKDRTRLADLIKRPELFDVLKLESILKAHSLEEKFVKIKLWMNG